ncbi:MAG: heme ABC transporter ATP-binding protein [Puniceicoccales bacterium]|jgi:iron complex transport system ATP-binding protein|nr:heme ABC transporter ATP-binding protein [Puniceicoccales bacterium]
MLAVSDITLIRSGKKILDNVSASFTPGETSAILGPNGAGKSTLLKIISGVIEPDHGAVSLNERPLKNYTSSELAKQRAFLAQESSLSFDFSVEEVVVLGRIPHLSGWESENDWEICEWALNAVEMSDFRCRRFMTLSGGEKQRIHLARVLAQLEGNKASIESPRWLLLDEPTSALDLRHQHSTLAMVKRFALEYGFGVLVVLHDLNLAMRYTDKILLLHHGQVSANGPTRTTLTARKIAEVYDIHARIFCESECACPFIQTEIPSL